MDIFNSRLAIHLCANSAADLLAATTAAKEALEAGTVAQANGFWMQYDEPTVIVSTDFDDSRGAHVVTAACRLLRHLHQALDQEAMYLTLFTPAGFVALCVYAGEWELAEAHLLAHLPAITDVLDYHALPLAAEGD